jgi:hypothetical protein
MKSFSLLSTTRQYCLLTLSLKSTCEAYALMTFKNKSLITNLLMMILSSYRLTTITSFLRHLSIKMPTPFMFCSFHTHYNLKLTFSNSLAFWSVHLVSWTHKIFTCLHTCSINNICFRYNMVTEEVAVIPWYKLNI